MSPQMNHRLLLGLGFLLILAFWLLVLAMLPSMATAANTYYLATPFNGGNDSNNCPANSPTTRMATFAKGISCLSAGDTLIVGSGTYTAPISIQISGTGTDPNAYGAREQPITIKSESPLGAIIRYASGFNHIIDIVQGVHDVVIDGLVLDFADLHYGIGVQVGYDNTTHHITLQHMEIKNGWDNNTGDSSWAIGGDYGHHILITGNHIHTMGFNYFYGPFDCVNPSFTYPACPGRSYAMYYDFNDSLVEKNEMNQISGVCFQQSPGPSDRNIFRNNYFHDCMQGILVASQGTDNQFYNNIVQNMGNPNYPNAPGLALGQAAYSPGNGNSYNSVVSNNTFYGNAYGGVIVGNANKLAQNSILRNNLFANNAAGAIILGTESGTVMDHNLCDVAGTGCTIVAPPGFVNATGTLSKDTDFKIQATSAAVNAGTTIATVTTDYFGTARPQGSAYDIGIHELGSQSANIPVITSASAANGTVGTAFSYQVTATNTPTSFGANPLPAGLSIVTTSGLISGTPTAAGTTSVTLTATNASGTGSSTLSLSITGSGQQPGNGLWHFEEGTGTTAADSIGTRTLTFTGGNLTWASGKVGRYSLGCDGAGYAGNATGFSDPQFTWMMWWKAAAAPGNGLTKPLMNGYTTEPWAFAYGHYIAAAKQSAEMQSTDNNFYKASITTPLVGGVWYHIAATYDGIALKVYLGGTLQATTPAPPPMALNGPLQVCGTQSAGADEVGQIDELKVWNRALTDAEVAQEYHTQTGSLTGARHGVETR